MTSGNLSSVSVKTDVVSVELPLMISEKLQRVSSLLHVRHDYEAIDFLISYWSQANDTSMEEEDRIDLSALNSSIDTNEKVLNLDDNCKSQSDVILEKSADVNIVCIIEKSKRKPGRPRKTDKLPEKICDFCGLAVIKTEMKAHICAHASDFPLPCSTCNGSVKSWSDWRRHENEHRHEREDSLICSLCGKTFETYNRFRAHRSMHKLEAAGGLICDQCGFCSNDSTVFNSHIRTVHGEKLHSCKLCSMKFAKASKLREHIETVHNGVRKFLCSDCGQSFKRNYALNVHKRIHSDEKPFRCHLCAYSGRQRQSLDSHLQTIHQIKLSRQGVGRPKKTNREISREDII